MEDRSWDEEMEDDAKSPSPKRRQVARKSTGGRPPMKFLADAARLQSAEPKEDTGELSDSDDVEDVSIIWSLRKHRDTQEAHSRCSRCSGPLHMSWASCQTPGPGSIWGSSSSGHRDNVPLAQLPNLTQASVQTTQLYIEHLRSQISELETKYEVARTEIEKLEQENVMLRETNDNLHDELFVLGQLEQPKSGEYS